MIPRRSLLTITLLVLALHALLLGGALPHWGSSQAAPVVRFTTRTIAAPVPAAAPAAAETVAQLAKPPVRAARKKPRPAEAAQPQPRTTAPTAPTAPIEPEEPTQAETLEAPIASEDITAPTAIASAPATDPPPAEAATAPGSAIAIAPPGAGDTPGSTQPAPVRLPAPARLEFDVDGQAKGFHYSARAELVWQHDGQQYQARQEISVLFLGSRAQTSVGDLTPLGLQPRRFGDRSRSEKAAHFDFAKGVVTFSANTPAAAIAPGAQDRLSVFLQLGAMLAAAPERYPAGTQISVPTVSSRAADTWVFTVGASEDLNLPMGPMRAVPLQRLPRRDYDQKAQLWLAPELGYLPVRIRITQANGDFAELNLRAHGAP
jgi:hypothetical protein